MNETSILQKMPRTRIARVIVRGGDCCDDGGQQQHYQQTLSMRMKPSYSSPSSSHTFLFSLLLLLITQLTTTLAQSQDYYITSPSFPHFSSPTLHTLLPLVFFCITYPTYIYSCVMLYHNRAKYPIAGRGAIYLLSTNIVLLIAAPLLTLLSILYPQGVPCGLVFLAASTSVLPLSFCYMIRGWILIFRLEILNYLSEVKLKKDEERLKEDERRLRERETKMLMMMHHDEQGGDSPEREEGERYLSPKDEATLRALRAAAGLGHENSTSKETPQGPRSTTATATACTTTTITITTTTTTTVGTKSGSNTKSNVTRDTPGGSGKVVVVARANAAVTATTSDDIETISLDADSNLPGMVATTPSRRPPHPSVTTIPTILIDAPTNTSTPMTTRSIPKTSSDSAESRSGKYVAASSGMNTIVSSKKQQPILSSSSSTHHSSWFLSHRHFIQPRWLLLFVTCFSTVLFSIALILFLFLDDPDVAQINDVMVQHGIVARDAPPYYTRSQLDPRELFYAAPCQLSSAKMLFVQFTIVGILTPMIVWIVVRLRKNAKRSKELEVKRKATINAIAAAGGATRPTTAVGLVAADVPSSLSHLRASHPNDTDAVKTELTWIAGVSLYIICAYPLLSLFAKPYILFDVLLPLAAIECITLAHPLYVAQKLVRQHRKFLIEQRAKSVAVASGAVVGFGVGNTTTTTNNSDDSTSLHTKLLHHQPYYKVRYILRSDHTYPVFLAFLRKEYSSENALFLQAVRGFEATCREVEAKMVEWSKNAVQYRRRENSLHQPNGSLTNGSGGAGTPTAGGGNTRTAAEIAEEDMAQHRASILTPSRAYKPPPRQYRPSRINASIGGSMAAAASSPHNFTTLRSEDDADMQTTTYPRIEAMQLDDSNQHYQNSPMMINVQSSPQHARNHANNITPTSQHTQSAHLVQPSESPRHPTHMAISVDLTSSPVGSGGRALSTTHRGQHRSGMAPGGYMMVRTKDGGALEESSPSQRRLLGGSEEATTPGGSLASRGNSSDITPSLTPGGPSSRKGSRLYNQSGPNTARPSIMIGGSGNSTLAQPQTPGHHKAASGPIGFSSNPVSAMASPTHHAMYFPQGSPSHGGGGANVASSPSSQGYGGGVGLTLPQGSPSHNSGSGYPQGFLMSPTHYAPALLNSPSNMAYGMTSHAMNHHTAASAPQPKVYTLPELISLHTSARDLRLQCLKIYTEYLRKGASSEINIPDELHSRLSTQIELIREWKPSPIDTLTGEYLELTMGSGIPVPPPFLLSIFYRSVSINIIDLLQKDSFRRFILTEEFLDLLYRADELELMKQQKQESLEAQTEAVMEEAMLGLKRRSEDDAVAALDAEDDLHGHHHRSDGSETARGGGGKKNEITQLGTADMMDEDDDSDTDGVPLALGGTSSQRRKSQHIPLYRPSVTSRSHHHTAKSSPVVRILAADNELGTYSLDAHPVTATRMPAGTSMPSTARHSFYDRDQPSTPKNESPALMKLLDGEWVHTTIAGTVAGTPRSAAAATVGTAGNATQRTPSFVKPVHTRVNSIKRSMVHTNNNSKQSMMNTTTPRTQTFGGSSNVNQTSPQQQQQMVFIPVDAEPPPQHQRQHSYQRQHQQQPPQRQQTQTSAFFIPGDSDDALEEIEF